MMRIVVVDGVPTNIPERGDIFVHPHMLDTDWRPPEGSGLKYADAPHLRCEVTAVRQGVVYFRAARPDRDPPTVGVAGDARGQWKVPLTNFVREGYATYA